MQNRFDTGGMYLLKIRRFMGCLSAPAFLGCFLLITAAEDIGTLLFSISMTSICGMALYKALITRRDGTLSIDERGIWIEQVTDPTAINQKNKKERTHIQWADIDFIGVGYGQEHPKQVAPNHIPIEPEKLARKSRFMAHMSGDDWSLIVDHNRPSPCHIYAANMNQPEAAGTALGTAFWSRGLIQQNEE